MSPKWVLIYGIRVVSRGHEELRVISAIQGHKKSANDHSGVRVQVGNI